MRASAKASSPASKGSGEDARVQVKFAQHGSKWLALAIAKLEPV